VTKAELTYEVSRKTSLHIGETENLLKLFFATLEQLVHGESVRFKWFGLFDAVPSRVRPGVRNVRFTAGETLARRIQG